ncbi:DMT family transporter [Cognatishimia sp. SS12]|uniref:DMT family transporter n=1 Tax=Cognatishimia sp. SS12 TaxID=2979465 RepID=UPI00232C2239|nr:DMT family transporter [Cognatishimia sp. SS12]MDC0737419.1 DMT family transporter [Cognatishimia sp. SS12]
MLDRIYGSPGLLLLYTGGLFGLTFPLGKLAAQAGIAPIVWAMVISLGAVIFIAPDLWRRRDFALPRGRVLRYVVISGLLSFALVNVLIFVLIPKLGAGHVGLMFALSPVFTLALSAAFRLKGVTPLGVIGIGFGLLGACIVALGRDGGLAGFSAWAALGIVLPMVLAVGNIYRTLDWPEGVHPATLAFWSQGAALLALILVQLSLTGSLPVVSLGDVPIVALVQLVAAALIFPAYFRLQHLGGPLLLSQTGYVAAATSLFSVTLFMGERYALQTWAGAALVFVGIALTILAQSKVSLRQLRV